MFSVKTYKPWSRSVICANENVKKTIKHAENLIYNGCHGVVFFGSTGQAQLIPISEKINLINEISKNKYFGRDEYFNSVIVNSNENLSGKIRSVKIDSCNQNTLFGEIILKDKPKEYAA